MTSTDTTQAADNLKLLDGIGPAIERRLHEAGVLTFAQLATMSAGDIAAILGDMAGFSLDRIEQQGWARQAKELVSPEATAEERQSAAGNGQHYATFTVELLLDDENEVRRTRVVHIQRHADDTWSGWDKQRLLAFVTQHAGLGKESGEEAAAPTAEAVPTTEEVPARPAPTPPPANMHSMLDPTRKYALRPGPINVAQMTYSHAEDEARRSLPQKAAELKTARSTKTSPQEALRNLRPAKRPQARSSGPVDLGRLVMRREADEAWRQQPRPQPTETAAAPTDTPPPQPERAAEAAVRLQAVRIVSTADDGPRRVLRHGQPFTVQLLFDRVVATTPEAANVPYQAAVYARDVEGGEGQAVGAAAGNLGSDEMSIVIPSDIRNPGLYRLEAQVIFDTPLADQTASLRGDLVQVY